MSVTIYTDIRAALAARLNALTGKPAVAWENVQYTPVLGTPYLAPFLMMGEPSVATIGTDGTNQEVGIYQITLANYPTNAGTGAILAMAGSIKYWFKRGTILSHNGVNVRIRKCFIGNLDYSNTAGVQLPLSISFYTQVNN